MKNAQIAQRQLKNASDGLTYATDQPKDAASRAVDGSVGKI